ncbi:unnamed protein product [Amoebophrya sp. A120]|nr:unnamed protein product [Amoebophrya sp. A120]|eukprot:GSA120T00019350001.1
MKADVAGNMAEEVDTSGQPLEVAEINQHNSHPAATTDVDSHSPHTTPGSSVSSAAYHSPVQHFLETTANTASNFFEQYVRPRKLKFNTSPKQFLQVRSNQQPQPRRRGSAAGAPNAPNDDDENIALQQQQAAHAGQEVHGGVLLDHGDDQDHDGDPQEQTQNDPRAAASAPADENFARDDEQPERTFSYRHGTSPLVTSSVSTRVADLLPNGGNNWDKCSCSTDVGLTILVCVVGFLGILLFFMQVLHRMEPKRKYRPANAPSRYRTANAMAAGDESMFGLEAGAFDDFEQARLNRAAQGVSVHEFLSDYQSRTPKSMPVYSTMPVSTVPSAVVREVKEELGTMDKLMSMFGMGSKSGDREDGPVSASFATDDDEVVQSVIPLLPPESFDIPESAAMAAPGAASFAPNMSMGGRGSASLRRGAEDLASEDASFEYRLSKAKKKQKPKKVPGGPHIDSPTTVTDADFYDLAALPFHVADRKDSRKIEPTRILFLSTSKTEMSQAYDAMIYLANQKNRDGYLLYEVVFAFNYCTLVLREDHTGGKNLYVAEDVDALTFNDRMKFSTLNATSPFCSKLQVPLGHKDLAFDEQLDYRALDFTPPKSVLKKLYQAGVRLAPKRFINSEAIPVGHEAKQDILEKLAERRLSFDNIYGEEAFGHWIAEFLFQGQDCDLIVADSLYCEGLFDFRRLLTHASFEDSAMVMYAGNLSSAKIHPEGRTDVVENWKKCGYNFSKIPLIVQNVIPLLHYFAPTEEKSGYYCVKKDVIFQNEPLNAFKVTNNFTGRELAPIAVVMGHLAHFPKVGPGFEKKTELPEISMIKQELEQNRYTHFVYVSFGSQGFEFSQEGILYLLRELGENLSQNDGFGNRKKVFVYFVKPQLKNNMTYEQLFQRNPRFAVPENVKLMPFAPQKDIFDAFADYTLQHNNRKLKMAFLAHCGVGGVTEATSRGIPILCLPLLFADQFPNCKTLEASTLGRDLSQLTAWMMQHDMIDFPAGSAAPPALQTVFNSITMTGSKENDRVVMLVYGAKRISTYQKQSRADKDVLANFYANCTPQMERRNNAEGVLAAECRALFADENYYEKYKKSTDSFLLPMMQSHTLDSEQDLGKMVAYFAENKAKYRGNWQ